MAITSEELVSTVHSPLGDDALFLTSLQGEEKVSGLFEIACRFTSEDDQVDFEALIGQPLCVETQMADLAKLAQRHANGCCHLEVPSLCRAGNIIGMTRLEAPRIARKLCFQESKRRRVQGFGGAPAYACT